MNETQLRDEICRIGRSLFERRLAHATAGNISVRLGDRAGGGLLITPADTSLGFLEPSKLARIHDSGRQTSGAPASSSLELHRRIYAIDPGAQCILHTHATHLIALTITGECPPGKDLVPPLTPYHVLKVGHVPLIPYRMPGDGAVTEMIARAIAASKAQGRPIRGVMLERLGPIVWHSTPVEAMGALEELEETARIWLLSGRAAQPLSDERIADLCRTFGAVW